jgi:hypothetical protein
MTAAPPSTIETTLAALRAAHPAPALTAGQVMGILKACGLGGARYYRTLKRKGLLVPLDSVAALQERATAPRYEREPVLDLMRRLLTPTPAPVPLAQKSEAGSQRPD